MYIREEAEALAIKLLCGRVVPGLQRDLGEILEVVARQYTIVDRTVEREAFVEVDGCPLDVVARKSHVSKRLEMHGGQTRMPPLSGQHNALLTPCHCLF